MFKVVILGIVVSVIALAYHIHYYFLFFLLAFLIIPLDYYLKNKFNYIKTENSKIKNLQIINKQLLSKYYYLSGRINTNRLLNDLIDIIYSNDTEHIWYKNLVFFYGLKKEGIIKKVMIVEEENVAVYLLAYHNSKESAQINLVNLSPSIEFISKKTNEIVDSYNLEEFKEIYEKYKEVSFYKLYKEIEFLINEDSKEILK